MSSLRSAVKSHVRTYKERSQLSSRKHLGLLEKHKDYVLRAKDYHRKQDHLKRLRKKAKERNPDEFYFNMLSQKTQDGVHVIQDQQKYSQAELLLMKTQDLNYINMKKSIETKKIEKLKANLHFLGEHEKITPSQHIKFVDSVEEAEADIVKRKGDEKRHAQSNESDCAVEEARNGAHFEFLQRQRRLQKLETTRQFLQRKKNLMGRGQVKKLKGKLCEGGSEQPVYRWRQERKK